MLEIICSWCNKSLGFKDGKGRSGITNTICEDCKQKILKEVEDER